eukprot:403356260
MSDPALGGLVNQQFSLADSFMQKKLDNDQNPPSFNLQISQSQNVDNVPSFADQNQFQELERDSKLENQNKTEVIQQTSKFVSNDADQVQRSISGVEQAMQQRKSINDRSTAASTNIDISPISMKIIDRKEANLLISEEFNLEELSNQGKGKYRFDKHVGKGQFGDVYEVCIPQKLALKRIKNALTFEDINEIQIMKHIKSDYICELLDIYTENDQKVCIVSELAKLGDLGKYSKKTFKNGDIPEDLAKEWLACTVLGLRELHVRGIIHRDIKPDNILVFEEKKIRIADYGMSKMLKSDEDPIVAAQLYGSINFRSPEITKGYSEGFLKLLKQMVSYEMDKRPKVVEIMFSPVLSKTEAIINYKARYGILALGFMNISQDIIEQLSQQDVGCPNCSLVLCEECMKKKEESPFIAIQSLLKHYQDINKKIEGAYVEAQDEVQVLPSVNPEVITKPFKIVLDQVKAIVESNLRQENIISQTTVDIPMERGIQTDDFLIEINCQSEIDKFSDDSESGNQNIFVKYVELKPEQNITHAAFQNHKKETIGLQHDRDQDSSYETDQILRLQQQLKEQVQPKIKFNYQPLRNRPITPSGIKNQKTIFSLQPTSPIKIEKSSFTQVHKDKLQSRNLNNNVQQTSVIVGHQGQSSIRKQNNNLNKTINHKRNFSDLSQIKNNNQLDQSSNNRNNNHRRDKSIDTYINFDQDSISISHYLQNQTSQNQKGKLNGSYIDNIESRKHKERDKQVDRDLYSTIQCDRGLLSSLIVKNENDLEQVLVQDFDNFVVKEVNSHKDSLLKGLLPKSKNLEFKQLYRATLDGFSQKALNQSMQSHVKGSTLIFILSDQGQTFGGYLSQPWPKGVGKFKDEKAFIFNLTKGTIHKQLNQLNQQMSGNGNSNKTDFAFEHNLFQLFAFGDDIRIFENCDQAKTSYCNLGHTYALPFGKVGTSEERESYMAGAIKFKVLEIEIYSLVEVPKTKMVMFSTIKATTKLKPEMQDEQE